MWVYPWPCTGGFQQVSRALPRACGRNRLPPRLLPGLAGSLQVWNCPSEKPRFYYTNRVDRNTGAEGGPMKLTPSTGFCYGYNDWGGINEFTKPYQGLGADITPNGREPWQKEVRESQVRAPSDMITVADSRSDAQWDTAY